MQLLLDTNAFIWFFEASPRINSVRDFISLPDNEVYVSAVSWWEMAIKIRTGKLKLDFSEMKNFVIEHNFIDLPLIKETAELLLNFPKIHNDPFDHMLLAQAITAPMRFITGDAALAEYSSLVMVI
jgi:PIN domain nuclease of toxin-antitoxin system